LILFGFNIFAATALHYRFNDVRVSIRTPAIVLIIVVFGMFSLVSPVAQVTTSPVGDEIPHSPRYVTEQSERGSDWTEKYSVELELTPIEQTGATTGRIDTSAMPRDSFYLYGHQRMGKSGAAASGGLTLGGRTWVFVIPPPYESESVVYSNGDTSVLQNTGGVAVSNPS
jgi:hypothetical protein